MLIEAITEGLALVAGPSTIKEMIYLKSLLEEYKVSKILIDGALFRKSIASFKVSDAAILSTGASYSKDINKVVNDTSLILEELTLPKASKEIIDLLNGEDNTLVIDSNFNKTIIVLNTVLSNEEVVSEHLDNNTLYLYLNGALSNKLVEALIDKRFELNSLTIIVRDATHIIIDADNLNKLKLANIKLEVINKINILLLTYNPHSPFGYDFNNEDFKELLQEKISLPILNVLKDME